MESFLFWLCSRNIAPLALAARYVVFVLVALSQKRPKELEQKAVIKAKVVAKTFIHSNFEAKIWLVIASNSKAENVTSGLKQSRGWSFSVDLVLREPSTAFLTFS